MKEFWQYVQEQPRANNSISKRTAYVLPEGYGYGFRGTNDIIRGLWPADNLSVDIWKNVTSLLGQYKSNLDIVYEDNLHFSAVSFSKLIFWNRTVLNTAIL
jgi:hypothetical protein